MKIRIDAKDVQDLYQDISELPQELMRDAGAYFKSITPIDQGYARRNTHTINLTIKANYDYAGRLDDGWSKQAPNGMTEPTIDYMERQIDKLIRGL